MRRNSSILLAAAIAASVGCSSVPSMQSAPANQFLRFWGAGWSDGYHECDQTYQGPRPIAPPCNQCSNGLYQVHAFTPNDSMASMRAAVEPASVQSPALPPASPSPAPPAPYAVPEIPGFQLPEAIPTSPEAIRSRDRRANEPESVQPRSPSDRPVPEEVNANKKSSEQELPSPKPGAEETPRSNRSESDSEPSEMFLPDPISTRPANSDSRPGTEATPPKSDSTTPGSSSPKSNLPYDPDDLLTQPNRPQSDSGTRAANAFPFAPGYSYQHVPSLPPPGSIWQPESGMQPSPVAHQPYPQPAYAQQPSQYAPRRFAQQPQYVQSAPWAQQPTNSQPTYPQPQYTQPQYAQPQYAQQQYPQQQYAQQQYAQPQYAQPQYAQPQYAQPQYAPQQNASQQYAQQPAPAQPYQGRPVSPSMYAQYPQNAPTSGRMGWGPSPAYPHPASSRGIPNVSQPYLPSPMQAVPQMASVPMVPGSSLAR